MNIVIENLAEPDKQQYFGANETVCFELEGCKIRVSINDSRDGLRLHKVGRTVSDTITVNPCHSNVIDVR